MSVDYKKTVRLPQTDFPMKADLIHREPQRLASWTADLAKSLNVERKFSCIVRFTPGKVFIKTNTDFKSFSD